MKLQLGALACLLAGCAMQPTEPARLRAEDGADAVLARLRNGNPVCLGVEFLPPMSEDAAIAVPAPRAEVERADDPRPRLAAVRTTPPPPLRDRASRHTWALTMDDLQAADSPGARATLQFLDDLMGEDRRRLRRELGTPALVMQSIDPESPGIDLRADEVRAEDEAMWLAENGSRLLRRPLQKLLRRTSWVSSIEVQIDELRMANAQLLEQATNADEGTDLGRVTMRIRASRPGDPIEIAYLRGGFRVGSSQEQLKVGYSLPLAEDVNLDVRARQIYDSGHWSLRADLSWEVSRCTSLHLVAGDALDFLTTSSVYSLFESPMDGSAGVLLYAVHLF